MKHDESNEIDRFWQPTVCAAKTPESVLFPINKHIKEQKKNKVKKINLTACRIDWRSIVENLVLFV